MRGNIKKIIAFLFLNFFLCTFFYILSSKGSKDMFMICIFALMWIPGISSIIVKLIYDRNIKGFGWKIGRLKYIALGYFIPLIGCLLVYGIVWITGIGGLTFQNFLPKPISRIVLLSTAGVLISCITAIGEEIGWRGFLVPEFMKSFSFTKTSLIIGVIWAIYHFPVIIFSDYNNGMATGYVLLFFTMQIVSLSFILTWIRLKSESMWPAVIIHASHNLFVQRVFDGLTKDFGVTKYITTDFGVGLAIFYIIIAIFYWKKSERLSVDRSNIEV